MNNTDKRKLKVSRKARRVEMHNALRPALESLGVFLRKYNVSVMVHKKLFYTDTDNTSKYCVIGYDPETAQIVYWSSDGKTDRIYILLDKPDLFFSDYSELVDAVYSLCSQIIGKEQKRYHRQMAYCNRLNAVDDFLRKRIMQDEPLSEKLELVEKYEKLLMQKEQVDNLVFYIEEFPVTNH